MKSATPNDRRIETWLAVLCAVPIVTIAGVYGEATLASVVLGHWPQPSLNDPKDLPTWPLHLANTLLILAVYPAALFTLAVLARSWRALRTWSPYWPWIVTFLVGHVIVFVSARMDPGGVWYWWWD